MSMYWHGAKQGVLFVLKPKRLFGLFACIFLISSMFGELSHRSGSLKKTLLTISANCDSSISGMMHNADTPMIASYNEALRGTGYGAGRLWTGELVNMAAVTFYTPRRVVPRSKYKTWVKIDSSEANT